MVPEEDGVPLIEHLNAAWLRTGEKPKMLAEAPPCPNGCEQVWRVFRELHASRGSSGLGPNRITYCEIDAYCRVTRTPLARWEIDAIRLVDKLFMADWIARRPEPGNGG